MKTPLFGFDFESYSIKSDGVYRDGFYNGFPIHVGAGSLGIDVYLMAVPGEFYNLITFQGIRLKPIALDSFYTLLYKISYASSNRNYNNPLVFNNCPVTINYYNSN